MTNIFNALKCCAQRPGVSLHCVHIHGLFLRIIRNAPWGCPIIPVMVGALWPQSSTWTGSGQMSRICRNCWHIHKVHVWAYTCTCQRIDSLIGFYRSMKGQMTKGIRPELSKHSGPLTRPEWDSVVHFYRKKGNNSLKIRMNIQKILHLILYLRFNLVTLHQTGYIRRKFDIKSGQRFSK